MTSERPASPSADIAATPAPLPSGHLGVRIEGQHPADVAFLFERGRRRMPGAAGVSIAVHIGALVFILLGLHYRPASPTATQAVNVVPLPNIVFLSAPGPGGGGGGGGNAITSPSRRAEMPGRDRTTVPVAGRKPVIAAPQVPDHNDPAIPVLNLAALPLAAGTETVVGTLDGSPGGPSRGPGTGNGAGGGNGDGVGPGTGDGLGPGSGGNTGGGPAGPGNGIEDPQAVYTPRPAYTAEAMRARIQGTAVVECVVQADGTVADAHVVRSLDPRFGLDVEAVKAASKWRFIPARRRGQPVAMAVAIQLVFSLY